MGNGRLLASSAAFLHPSEPQALLPNRLPYVRTPHLAHLRKKLSFVVAYRCVSYFFPHEIIKGLLARNVPSAILLVRNCTNIKSFTDDFPKEGRQLVCLAFWQRNARRIVNELSLVPVMQRCARLLCNLPDRMGFSAVPRMNPIRAAVNIQVSELLILMAVGCTDMSTT